MATPLTSIVIDPNYHNFLSVTNDPPDPITSAGDVEPGKLINRKCALCNRNMQLNASSIKSLYQLPTVPERIAALAALNLRSLDGCGHIAYNSEGCLTRTACLACPARHIRTEHVNRGEAQGGGGCNIIGGLGALFVMGMFIWVVVKVTSQGS